MNKPNLNTMLHDHATTNGCLNVPNLTYAMAELDDQQRDFVLRRMIRKINHHVVCRARDAEDIEAMAHQIECLRVKVDNACHDAEEYHSDCKEIIEERDSLERTNEALSACVIAEEQRSKRFAEVAVCRLRKLNHIASIINDSVDD